MLQEDRAKVEMNSIWRAVQPTRELTADRWESVCWLANRGKSRNRYKAHSLQDFQRGRTIVVCRRRWPASSRYLLDCMSGASALLSIAYLIIQNVRLGLLSAAICVISGLKSCWMSPRRRFSQVFENLHIFWSVYQVNKPRLAPNLMT